MAEVHYFNSEFSKDRVQGSKPVRYEYKNGVHLAVMDQSRIHTTVTLDDIAKVAQSRGIGHLGSSATTEAVAKAIAQKTGQPDVEIKVLELTEKGRKFFGFAKRVNVAFGNVSDVYEVFVAEDKVRAVAGVIGGNAGAWAASEMTAAVCAPLLAVPGGAFVYFPVVFTAGYYGYQLGSQAAQQCYEVVVRELPPDVNFVDFTRAFLDQ